MNWNNLLCTTRIRDLRNGSESGSEHRTEFERDYDRIVFSSPVRRLKDKTQVFPLDPNDFVRTRLTHSMEVASVARGLTALAIKNVDDQEFTANKADLQTVAATAALVHDLGNPPFGHFGESSICSWFTTPTGSAAVAPIQEWPHLAADLTKFEGNARTLRLLGNLQILADRHGMNLTAATFAACMKYTASSLEADPDHSNHAKSKPGYCQTEREVVELVRNATGIGSARHPLAFIVEAADDCVYSICDLEDGVRKGVVSWRDLATHLHKNNFSDLAESVERDICDRARQGGIDLDHDCLDDTYSAWFRVKGQGMIIESAAKSFADNYISIMSGAFDGELLPDDDSSEGARLTHTAKKFGRNRVYTSRSTIELELRGHKVLHDLLDSVWPGALAYQGSPLKPKNKEGKAWSLLSTRYRNVFESDWKAAEYEYSGEDLKAWRHYLKLMLVTDYVSGMTDGYATTLHKSLCNA